MIILELIYNIISMLVGLYLMSCTYEAKLTDKTITSLITFMLQVTGLLLFVGGLYHLLGQTLVLPKP